MRDGAALRRMPAHRHRGRDLVGPRPRRQREPRAGEPRPRQQEQQERGREREGSGFRDQDEARDHREREVAPARHVERVQHLHPQEQRRERDARLVERDHALARRRGTARAPRAAPPTARSSAAGSANAGAGRSTSTRTARATRAAIATGAGTAPGCATTAAIATSTAPATTTRIATESSGGPDGRRSSSLIAAPPRSATTPKRLPSSGRRRVAATGAPRPPPPAAAAPRPSSALGRQGACGRRSDRPPAPRPPWDPRRRATRPRERADRRSLPSHVGKTSTAVSTPQERIGSGRMQLGERVSAAGAVRRRARRSSSSRSPAPGEHVHASPRSPRVTTNGRRDPCASAASATDAAAEHARSSGVNPSSPGFGVAGGIDDDREPPGLLLLELAHHHRAGARGRGPVHVPHAVAGPVLADAEVLRAVTPPRSGVHRRLGRRRRAHERQRVRAARPPADERAVRRHRDPAPAFRDAERRGGPNRHPTWLRAARGGGPRAGSRPRRAPPVRTVPTQRSARRRGTGRARVSPAGSTAEPPCTVDVDERLVP